METIPVNIPSASLEDDNVDLNIILRFFSRNGWSAIQHVMRERRQIGWLC